MAVRTENLNAYLSNRMEELKRKMILELNTTRQRKYRSGTINAPITASGRGIDSLEVRGLELRGSDYLLDVDKGTNDTDADVSDIIQWAKDKKIRLKDRKGRFVKMSDYSLERFALNVVKKLEDEGIEPANFIEPTSEWFIKRLNDIDEPILEDLSNELNKILGNAGFTKKGNKYYYGDKRN